MIIPKVAWNKIYYKKGFKYQLCTCYRTRTKIRLKRAILFETGNITKGGILTIYFLDACDGPSGPTIDSRKNMRAAWEHDFFMKLFRARLLSRKKWLGYVNKRFYRILLKDGMSKTKAYLYYKGGSFGARSASKPKNLKKVYHSP